MKLPDPSGSTCPDWARAAGMVFGSAPALLTATVVVLVLVLVLGGLSLAFAQDAVAVVALLPGVAIVARSRAGG